MASSDARVEMTFCLDDQLYALEHTGIEPFDGFMKLQNTASQRVEPFRADITRGLSSHFAAGMMLVMDPAGRCVRRLYQSGRGHSFRFGPIRDDHRPDATDREELSCTTSDFAASERAVPGLAQPV